MGAIPGRHLVWPTHLTGSLTDDSSDLLSQLMFANDAEKCPKRPSSGYAEVMTLTDHVAPTLMDDVRVPDDVALVDTAMSTSNRN